MTWVPNPGGFLNLARASRVMLVPNDQHPGEWAVLAHFGPHTSFVASFPSRDEAGEYAASVLFPKEVPA